MKKLNWRTSSVARAGERGAALGREDVQRLTFAEVLDAVGSSQPSSGAGIAAALALALAAACGRKAAGVTLKHRAAPELEEIDERLKLLEHRAVAHAQRDELLFRAYVETKEPVQAERLVESSQHFQQLVEDVGKDLERLSSLVADSVIGDIDAARALHDAAARVASGLLREARAERSKVTR